MDGGVEMRVDITVPLQPGWMARGKGPLLFVLSRLENWELLVR